VAIICKGPGPTATRAAAAFRLAPALLVVATLLSVVRAEAQEAISFQTPDGGTIRGDLYGTGNRGVVIVAHGGYSTRARWAPQARTVADAGFQVLIFDTRAGAELKETGKETDCLYDPACMAVDVLAAVRYLRRNGASTVSVIGGSAGGGAAAQASIDAHDAEIDRLVLLAPMAIEVPEKMSGRKLFVTARDDRNDAGLRLPGIQNQFARAPGPKELVLVDGSAHGQFIFDTPEGERLMREILRFLSAP
jgi:acetyl esterase/lipase